MVSGTPSGLNEQQKSWMKERKTEIVTGLAGLSRGEVHLRWSAPGGRGAPRAQALRGPCEEQPCLDCGQLSALFSPGCHGQTGVLVLSPSLPFVPPHPLSDLMVVH